MCVFVSFAQLYYYYTAVSNEGTVAWYSNICSDVSFNNAANLLDFVVLLFGLSKSMLQHEGLYTVAFFPALNGYCYRSNYLMS